jgi:hypothetical protein
MHKDHVRIEHPDKGPVHIFQRPEHDDRSGVVIYLHGWNLKRRLQPWYVDQVIEEHEIGRKFSDSYSNATLIVPACKEGRGQPVQWPNIEELLDFVDVKTGLTTAIAGQVHAVGHSGAYVNIKSWLGYELLNHITLLDAFYGWFKPYTEWAVDTPNRLDLAVSRGSKPHKNAYRLLRKLADYHVIQRLPMGLTPVPACRVLYAPLELKHMEWVTTSHALSYFLHRAEILRLGCC